jgi:hypothetical protein
MITVPPGRRSSMFARSAAGLNATEHVGMVGRGAHVGRGEVDLETRDAGERARWGADLGGEIGQGGEVVAGERGRLGELGAGELDAISGVAAKTDRHAFDLLGGLPHGCRSPPPFPFSSQDWKTDCIGRRSRAKPHSPARAAPAAAPQKATDAEQLPGWTATH